MLEVARAVDFGFYLDGEDLGEILLPENSVRGACKVGDHVKVFIYRDSEDRLIATMETPYAEVGDFALLRVVAVERVGAFVDWGLSKDLLVPFREQKTPMLAGRSYVVRVYLDEKTDRIVASARLDRFLGKVPSDYEHGREVELLITRRTDLGFTAIVDDTCWGILYANQVFRRLDVGQRLTGYVNKVRSDGKLDLILDKPGYQKVGRMADEILDVLEANRGFLPLTSKSSPEEISRMLGMSKKNFKKAAGALYKERLVSIDEDGLRRLKS